ncbi:MAG: pitrilysin family protein [Prevotella sp.]|nr:pitrilysin family protein [Prevotella sp.]
MKYNTTSLSNGLRVIHLASTSPVVYCGYEIAAGSACEAAGEEGLAHFCEHVTFKGTERRNALQIINTLESVGGDLNAYTTKTDTVYYASLLHEHLPRAVDVLTDIVFHSIYPQSEINKEVEVICDEIESYNDSPAELIYDDFDNLLFKGHELGHNILGTAQNVRSFTTADALQFTRKFYLPQNAIFFAYGNIDFRRLVRLLEKAHGAQEVGPKKADGATQKAAKQAAGYPDWAQKGTQLTLNKGTHQAHVMVGNRAYCIHDERRMALYLLNNILGGPGMNARLNLALRERRGLVYTVESTMASYDSTGEWCVYLGCDPQDVGTCLRLVRKELDRLMDKPLSDRQLAKAKRQIKGQIGVACDNRENFALDFGKSFLHYGWEKDVEQLFKHIDAITPEAIMQVANDIFPAERLSTLIYR